MNTVGRFLTQQPLHIIGLVGIVILARALMKRRRAIFLVRTLARLIDVAWTRIVGVRKTEAYMRMILLRIWPVLAITTSLAGCAATASHEAATASLVGTRWELVAIQSMDDAQGTTRIASPERITVSFAGSGRVSFRLDCNRGTATWQSAPGADNSTGTLQFGPIAGTRAMCRPPHLDERVVRDLAYVRSYLRKDGKLFMSLMADGGIYEWRPAKQ